MFRADVAFVKKKGKRKIFHIGGNSSCRTHIRKHYQLYKQRCKEGNIPENHHALPRQLWKELEDAKRNPKAMQQGKLDGAFKAIKESAEFTREGVLHAVTRFVACDDQVRNVLWS
jgi:DNA-binding LacI/PurR family transcriptional regulator